MDTREFVKAYPDSLKPGQIHSGPHSALIHDAQEWSYRFGLLLHMLLSSQANDAPSMPTDDFDDYMGWAKHNVSDQEIDLITQPDGLRARNEINFHTMNRCMVNLWTPLFSRLWSSDKERLSQLAYSQRTLAFMGTVYYVSRQDYTKHHGDHALFEPAFKEILGTMNGFMQEYDAAIILLDIIRRHPSLTLVPAPLQFERTIKRTNVDFIVTDVVSQQAVGIQVKTNVRQSDINIADSDRVVLIDGNVDLQNVKAVRTRRRQSDQRVVPWPGLIAAHYIQSLRAKGSGPERMSTHELQSQLRLKMHVQPHIGGIRVDRREIAKSIGERILAKLYT